MLPETWCWTTLEEIAEIAPSIPTSGIADDQPVHFVPMASVAENFAGVKVGQERLLSEVRKGYTAFAEGDVLLAKITPCMENGKGGIVPTLPYGMAFGSTEFHVLRPSIAISSQWLSHFLSQPVFRKYARSNMTGTAGQMRVPAKWLRSVEFPVPPRAEQTRIVAKLEALLSDLDAGVAELKAAQKKLAQYRQSLLKAAVEGALTAEWRAARAPLPPRGGGVGGEGGEASGEGGETSGEGEGASGEGQNARPNIDPTWLLHRSRELRRAQTPAEQALWQQLRAKRFSGFKFRRQQPLGRYIVDFVCFTHKLIIELDGGQHADAQSGDADRDAWLKQQGFRVLRFWNNEWATQPEAVLEAIWLALQAPPLPNPSPARGEGLKPNTDVAPLPPGGGGAGGEGTGLGETAAQLLQRILTERRARWEAKQLAKFQQQGKTPPKDWQKKYPEPVPPDTTDLPELPEGWVWASVDQLLADIETGKSFKCEERPPQDHEIGVAKVSAVTWGKYNEQESKTCHDESMIRPDLFVKTGDFLFSRANTIELVGACVIAQTVTKRVMLSDKILRLVLVHPELKNWLLALLRSELGRKHIEMLASGNQESMRNIGQERLRQIPVPLPPLSEIKQASELLSGISSAAKEQEQAVELALKQSTAQRQNILRAAFAGELVPQDPNDEPASALLARIRAERAARDAVSKPRGRKVKT